MLISLTTNINFHFYQVPRFILNNYYTQELTPIARLLYILLYGQMLQSLEKHQTDRTGRVYIRMSKMDMSEALGVSKPTAMAAFKSLVECGLICEKQVVGEMPFIYFCEPKWEAGVKRCHDAEQAALDCSPFQS